MKYLTGNPLGSTDVRDLLDNAIGLDDALNDVVNDTWTDRFGRVRKTLKGYDSAFEEDQAVRAAAFQAFLEASGWQALGAYAAGISITSHTQTVDYQGQPYQLKPSVPASIDAPYVTTGNWATEGVNFKLVGDNSLRQELASATGESLVGEHGNTVADKIGDTNQYASGGIVTNKRDYATLDPSSTPALSGFTKTNFDASGFHTAGTVGTMTATAAGPEFSLFIVTLVIKTTANGYVNVKLGDKNIFGDQPNGYRFSTAPVKKVGVENNRDIDDITYEFLYEVSAGAFSGVTVVTDLTWEGRISAVSVQKVNPMLFASGGAAAGQFGVYDPYGIKGGGYLSNDVAMGDKGTLASFVHDGLPKQGAHHCAMGAKALGALLHGDQNTAFGTYAGQHYQTSNSVFVGYSAGKMSTKGRELVFVGYKAGTLNTTGSQNVAVGFWCFGQSATGDNNTGMGYEAGRNLLDGGFNTALGALAGRGASGGDGNTWVGAYAGYGPSNGAGVTTFNGMTCIGRESLTLGNYNVALGQQARAGTVALPSEGSVAIGYNTQSYGSVASVAIGHTAIASEGRAVAIGQGAIAKGEQSTSIGALSSAPGQYVTSIGAQAGSGTTGTNNTFVGAQAGAGANAYTNCTALGVQAVVTGSNQVQLGNSATTVYAYGAVQNRCDGRDKCDLAPTELGLEFIRDLKPVQGRWDMRDDYVTYNADGSIELLPRDGSKARTRLHQWFVAQDVVATCEKQGVDFGGVQHHAHDGGQDVYTIGYAEFIPPITRAVQQVDATVLALIERVQALEAMLKSRIE